MVGVMEQRTPEWHEARKARLTASMAGAALGLAPYQSKEDCMRALVRDMHGLPSEFQGNIATEYGNANEDLARAAYEMHTGNDVQPAGFVPLGEWSGASPDGYVEWDGLLEIKCPFGLRKDPNPAFKSVKDQPHYYAQMQLQLFVTDRLWCDFWQWSPHGHRLDKVVYDFYWIAKNLPRLKAFWIEAKQSDPAEHEGPKRVMVDTPEADKLIAEYDELSEAIENAAARKKDIVARLVDMAGGRNAEVAGRNLTLVKRAGAVSYAKALKAIAPDADLEPYRGKPSESWQVK